VVILSLIAPLFCSNGEPPFATGRMPVTSVALVRLTREDESVPFVELWTIPAVGLNADRTVVPLMVVVAPD